MILTLKKNCSVRSSIHTEHARWLIILPYNLDDYGWQAFSSIEGNSAEGKIAETQKAQKCFCAAERCSGYLEKKESNKQAQFLKRKQKRVGSKLSALDSNSLIQAYPSKMSGEIQSSYSSLGYV